MTTALAVPGLDQLATNPEARERFESAACHMAREYADAVAIMRAALEQLDAQAVRIQEAFSGADAEHKGTWNNFELEYRFDGRTIYYRHRDGRDVWAELFAAYRKRAWRMLVDHLGVKNVMSMKRREEFDKQLESGDLPEITEATIVSTVLGLAGEAKNFAAEAAREVFDMLRPQRSEYKTNSPYRVGRRVILPYWIRPAYGRGVFGASYNRDKEFRALEGAFLLLDGRGVVRDGRPELVKAIEASPDGRGETEFFRFKCFKNQNLHLEFKRLDLVKKLNGLAAGEYVLGADID